GAAGAEPPGARGPRHRVRRGGEAAGVAGGVPGLLGPQLAEGRRGPGPPAGAADAGPGGGGGGGGGRGADGAVRRGSGSERGWAWLEGLQAPGRRPFRSYSKAYQTGQAILEREQACRWLRVRVEAEVQEEYRQTRPGRPGPDTEYRRVDILTYRVHFDEDGTAGAGDALCDGLFPLVTNDEGLSLKEALAKYKYQPFLEKRHEQLKSVFGVAPVWLKSPRRVASLLWLYFVVELVQALVEREVRQQMRTRGLRRLNLYPEGPGSAAPTAGLVFSV